MHPEERAKHIAGLEQQLKKLTAEEEASQKLHVFHLVQKALFVF